MKGISNFGSHVQATNAYKKATDAGIRSPLDSSFNNRAIPKKPLNILRQGDFIDIVANNLTKSAGISTFPELLKLVSKDYVKKLKKAERQTAGAIAEGSSLVEVMGAVNESEIVLQKVIAVRDRFISAYQDILRMPL